jgi:AraC-like DNA-binding protein
VKKEMRKAAYDSVLNIEACRFQGILQPFPPHFHEYYVIGLMEEGERRLICGNMETVTRQGDILVFYPGDTHSCVQAGAEPMDYRALHIPAAEMERLAEERHISVLPAFSQTVVSDRELADCFRHIHQSIMDGRGAENRGKLLRFLSALWVKYGGQSAAPVQEYREVVEKVCAFLETHFAEHITLEGLCCYAGLSKSTLLRAFTKNKGITPYRYLETLRIGEAKKLLEQGVPPVDAALRTGFSDQSHFSRYFHLLIGLSPGAYRDIFTGNNTEEKE